MYKPQLSINGVFSNKTAIAINASLWTIPQEFTMYILLTTLHFIKKYQKVIYFLLPHIVVLFGLLYNSVLQIITNFTGDISYGVYIYAFPVQQFLAHFYTLNALQLMLWSIILVTPLAILS